MFRTAAVAYFGDQGVQELTALLEAVERDVAWVSGAASSILGGTPVAEGAPLHFALMAGRPGALVRAGRMGHHGGWLEWLG